MPEQDDVATLILAGGEARRLGGIDKTLIEIGGIPILLHILERLRPSPGRVALSANGDPGRFGKTGLPVIQDRHAGIGPLAGLLRGLEWAADLGAASLLTVPGDTPFIPERLAERLSPAPAVAVSAGRRHHLVALWPVAWRGALERHLQALDAAGGGRRGYGVRAFADAMGIREVEFATAPFDPFFNVNTPGDRAEAELLRSVRTSAPVRPAG